MKKLLALILALTLLAGIGGIIATANPNSGIIIEFERDGNRIIDEDDDDYDDDWRAQNNVESMGLGFGVHRLSTEPRTYVSHPALERNGFLYARNGVPEDQRRMGVLVGNEAGGQVAIYATLLEFDASNGTALPLGDPDVEDSGVALTLIPAATNAANSQTGNVAHGRITHSGNVGVMAMGESPVLTAAEEAMIFAKFGGGVAVFSMHLAGELFVPGGSGIVEGTQTSAIEWVLREDTP